MKQISYSKSIPVKKEYDVIVCGGVPTVSGENDGLVDQTSFKCGEKHILLRTTENRGISHGDVIDLNRQNFKGFDVRDFYINLVSELKNKGL